MIDAENPQAIAGMEVTESKDYHLLPVDQRAQLALASSKTETDLKAMVEKHATITEIKDKAGREQAHGAAMELMRARTTVANVSKAARDDATKFSRAVIAEENRLIAIVEAEEKRLKDLRDAWDDEQARLKREAEERERQRLLAIAGQINDIKAFAPLATQCRTSVRIQELIDRLTAVTIDPEVYAEYADDAAAVKSTALNQMAATLKAKQDQEAEAKRLADERAALERDRQEQEERQRQLNAQAEALALQQKELDAARAAAAPKVVEEKTADPAPAIPIIPPSTKVMPPQEFVVLSKCDGTHEGEVCADPQCWQNELSPNDVVTEPPKAARPTDDVIIGALALHFRAHEMEVVSWLLDMDLVAASERISAGEFA